MASSLTVGDLVWAKMKGFSAWPGKIVSPTKDVKRPANKKPMQCVFFFGSDNYAWIPEESIKPYETYKDQLTRANKSTNFKEAVEAIEDFIRNKPEVPIKTSDLPSIGEEIAAIFPNGSDRMVTAAPHKDYSRQPFQAKPPKGESTPGSTPKSTTPGVTPKPAPVKRTLSDSGSTGGSIPKRPKLDKDTEKSLNDGNKGKSSPAAKVSNTSVSAIVPSISVISTSVSSLTNHSTPRKTAENLLTRPSCVTRPLTPPMDVERVSETLLKKKIKPSGLKFGFLGLGIMGKGIIKNLINSDHSLTIWNRTPSKCRDFSKAGAHKCQTPADVIAASDVTFSCVADPRAVKELVFGNCGVLQEIKSGKGYVEMTSIDVETSQDLAEAITAQGGRYLEAQIQGSKNESEEGTLVILASGDKSLFDDCYSSFQAMAKNTFYLGEVGNASKMNLVINLVMGTTMAGLAEGMALADRAGLQQKDVLEVLELGSLSSGVLREKGRAVIEGAFPTAFPLQHMQKDLRLALEMGDQLEQPLPMTATANEVFKHAKRLGYGDHDVSAIYIRARF